MRSESERNERRAAERFDKAFPVSVESRDFGECVGVARNISAGGMFVEMSEPLPLGSRIRVHFAIPEADGTLIARGQVKRHYFLQFSDGEGPRVLTGIGIRFECFEDESEGRLTEGLARWKARTLH